MKQLRILHLITAASRIAGAERLLVDIAEHASGSGRHRWDVGFATLSRRGDLHDAIAVYGHPTFALDLQGIRSVAPVTWRLRRLIAEFRPHVLHTHLSHAAIAGAIATLPYAPLRVVQTRHYSGYISQFRSHRRMADAWAARRADRVIAVSEPAREQLINKEHVSANSVCVIENGVNVERLSNLDSAVGRRALHGLGVDPNAAIIGCAASFNVCKGHDNLLDAMKLVLDSRASVSLVLLGNGELETSLRAQAERLGIASRVHFFGHRADAHQLMAGMDIYVQPSVEEGFGLAAVEAMAMRRPIVGTAVGGLMRTIVPEETGLLVPPNQPRALAESLTRLLEDPEFAKELGHQACERAGRLYSLSRMFESYDHVYRS